MNTLAAVTPRLLAMGLLALRNMNVMPMLVNTDYSAEFARRGITVDVPIPSAITVQDVAPANVPPATSDVEPSFVAVPLDQWKEAPFYLTDKNMQQAMEGIMPIEASEAVAGLMDTVNGYILSVAATGIRTQVGTAGTTPFATANNVSDATNVRKALNVQKAPKQFRRAVLDPDAEANALNQRPFNDTSWSASPEAIMEGNINRKFAIDWYSDQQVGKLPAPDDRALAVNDAHAAGVTEVHLDGGGAGQILEKGARFTIAGDTTIYYVSEDATGANFGNVKIFPALKTAAADNAVVTVLDATANLAFHRNCIAFVNRPLEGLADGLGSIIQSAQDEVTGLIMRLEVSREHKRTRFSYDMLYGARVVRPELGVVLLG